jgi:hypothetical protein
MKKPMETQACLKGSQAAQKLTSGQFKGIVRSSSSLWILPLVERQLGLWSCFASIIFKSQNSVEHYKTEVQQKSNEMSMLTSLSFDWALKFCNHFSRYHFLVQTTSWCHNFISVLPDATYKISQHEPFCKPPPHHALEPKPWTQNLITMEAKQTPNTVLNHRNL